MSALRGWLLGATRPQTLLPGGLLGATRPQTPRQEAGGGFLHLAAVAARLDPKFDTFLCQIAAMHAHATW